MKIRIMTFFLGLILILTACTSQPAEVILPTDVSLILPTLALTKTSAPTATFEPMPTVAPIMAPTEAPTPTPFATFEVTVWADGVKLRTNPGYLFPALRLLPQNTRLEVWGKAPGNEWVYVSTLTGEEGWVFADLIQTDINLTAIPVIEPEDVQTVRGRVVDLAGNPVSGIAFMLSPKGSNEASRSDALTDVNGEFIAFLPETSSGGWTVAHTGISCKSNLMTANCDCVDGICGTTEPQAVEVTLPTDETLNFTWK